MNSAKKAAVPFMKRFPVLTVVLAIAILAFGAVASITAPATIETDGTLDSTFDAGSFTNGQVLATALQPDGKLLVGGQFSKMHGVAHLGIARLNADATLDPSFNVVFLPGSSVSQIIVQPDSIIVLGGFSTGTQFGIARLNSDGSVDGTFDLCHHISLDGNDDGTGIATNPGTISSAVLQADGKMVVVGHFFYVTTGPGTNTGRSCVARFNSDGTFDPSYNPGKGLDNGFNSSSTNAAFAVRQNIGSNSGKIIIEGNFDIFDLDGPNQHSNLPGLVRLNTDGSFDSTFHPGAGDGLNSVYVSGLFVQADDRIVLFGSLLGWLGVPCNNIVRLDTAGQRDTGFTVPTFGNYDNFPQVLAIAQQPDGKLVVGGTFHSLDGTVANTVARLETSGAKDDSFDSTVSDPLASNVNTIIVRSPDNSILLGGYFSTYGGATRNNIAWLNADGSVGNRFSGLSGVTEYDPEIYAVAVQSDGKILVGGFFTSFNGVPHYNLVRLNPDSTIDSSFDPNLGTAGSVRAMLVQPDGKIVIAGNILAVNGIVCGRIARLNVDGTLDPFFDTGTGADSSIYALAQDSSGNIYAGGAFSTFDGGTQLGIVKIGPSGGVDPAFNPGGGGANSTVFAITSPDTSGGIVIAGQFSKYNGATARAIARIDATTGARDPAFNSANTYYGLVKAVLATPDGKYYFAGSGLVRLNSNGSRDTTFTPPSTGGYIRNALALQNGKLFVAGHAGPALSALARLTSTGGLDSSFDPGTGVEVSPSTAFWANSPELKTLAIQADGKLLLGGIFNKYNGSTRIGLARLTSADAPTPTPGLVGNVSTRLPVGTGDNALIEGFIVQGPAGSTKKILVRAIGPSLIPFGITDALTNPTLEIHDSSGATVAMNNDWKVTQTGLLISGDQSAEISASGLAPGNDLESAIIANLAPGSYTAVVSGVGNSTGTGVVDAYDLSGASPAKLANIATRGLIQAGDKLMIAGFIVQNAPVRAVVRAIGPSLLAFGISNALADTTLQLRDQNGAVVIENDDWKTSQQQELENTGLQPSNDLEAALVTTLQPGQYTAQVRGKNDSSGIGVVQVYFLQ
jgi:uncharacterized delta-60 repeat protein